MKYSSLRQGLIGAWCPSLGATGYRLLDRSGYGNHGTLTNMDAGTDWVGGPYGISLDFDGNNDFVNCSNRINNLTTGNITISCWASLRTFSGTQGILSNIASNGVNCTFQLEFGRTANKLGFLQNGYTVDAVSTASISDSNVRHICAVRVGSPGNWTITFHFDNQFSSHATVFNPSANATSNLSIGRPGDFDSHYINAKLDDVRLYNRALSLAEIRLLASEPGIGLKPERVSVYFGESLSSRRRKILTGLA